MNRRFGACVALLALVSCRNYQYEPHITSQDGLVPPDRFARYGKEQAEAVAIGREYGKAAQGDSPEALTKQADAAIAYARTCLLYTSPSPRDGLLSRMPSSA